MFQGPKRRPNDLIFHGHQFLEGTKRRSEGSEQTETRGPKEPDSLAAWDPLSWASRLRCRRSFFQKLRLDLKPTIKIVPDALRKGAPQKHRNHETETWSCRLEGENSGGALPGWSPSSPTTSPPSPWWRGSSPPLDYGFVEVTYVSLLSWASLISTVWAAEHDYGHLCNTFVVDLFMS